MTLVEEALALVMQETWIQLLAQNSTPVLPPIFVKYDLQPSKSTVYLTDLNNIWSETLVHKATLDRAATLGTSIDPNEDLGQLPVLLNKIQEAFQREGESTSRLFADDRPDVLLLETTTPLPSPFAPLCWQFQLSRLAHNAVTQELLLPLLKEQAALVADLRSLIRVLEEKDHILTKLLDKIENSHTDLTDVFPSLRSGRKVPSRSIAQNTIPGLAPFSLEKVDLTSEIARTVCSKHEGLPSNFLATAFGNGLTEKTVIAKDNWWVKLSRPTDNESWSNEARQEQSEPHGVAQSPTMVPEDATGSNSQSSNDDFETQEIPPKRSVNGRQSTVSSVPSLEIPSHSKGLHNGTRIGRIGGKIDPPISSKQKGKDRLSNTPPRRANLDQELTESDNDLTISLTSSTRNVGKAAGSPSRAKRTGKLGIIGGKNQQKSPSPSAEKQILMRESIADDQGQESPQEAAQIKRRRRLGAIGGRSRLEHEQTASQTSLETAANSRGHGKEIAEVSRRSDTRPKFSKKSIMVPKPTDSGADKEETEEERADRRRLELKHSLKKKPIAGPKKKRKF